MPHERHADNGGGDEGVAGPRIAPRESPVRQVIDGRYRVVDTLGTGCLATVYLCDEIATGQRLAVKLFRREFAKDDEFMNRLRRQAKLAMSLQENRPTLLTVYGCDRTRDGGAYVATEYLQGRTLKDIIRRGGPLDVQRGLRLACQIAGALDAIHDRGFVHKDLRADHVIVMTRGEDETAKLKGFEVAGLRETPLVEHLLRAGVIPANAEYATPEQIEGDQLTARTDIYAFGVLLYEMLTGRLPFAASSPDGIYAKHLQELPPPLTTFRRDIPSVLELRVKQALEKEPEKRQRYVGDVVNEYLCELAAEEIRAEEARQKRGVIGKIAARVQARVDAPSRDDATGLGWKFGVGAAVLAAAFATAMWVFWPAPKAEQPAAPVAERRLGVPPAERERPVPAEHARPRAIEPPVAAVDVPKPSDKGVTTAAAPKETSEPAPVPASPMPPDTVGPDPPGVPRESSLRPPGASPRLEKGVRPPARVEPPPTRERAPAPAPEVKVPTVAPQRPPTPARGGPDPTEIIDWLLNKPPGGQ